MNPNIPYGQSMPMHGQTPQRRHEMPYVQMPPHMRLHPGYAQYYPQPMPPMMPPYPQHYQQNWYQYPQHFPQHHGARPQYYQHPMPPMVGPQMHHHHHGQMYSPQPPSHASPRPVPAPVSMPVYQPQIPSSTPSTTSVSQTDTPSRPTSTASVVNPKPEQTLPVTPISSAPQLAEVAVVEAPVQREPFVPPVPWLSTPGQPFPARARRMKRKILRSSLGTEPVTFPLSENLVSQKSEEALGSTLSELPQAPLTPTPNQETYSQASEAPSEMPSTQPTTPSSTTTTPQAKAHIKSTQANPIKATGFVVPVVPVLPNQSTTSCARQDSVTSKADQAERGNAAITTSEEASGEAMDDDEKTASLSVPPPPPSSWAALLRSKNAAASAGVTAVPTMSNGLTVPRNETLKDVLNEISVAEKPSKIVFLQPRGLVNTGNMCYMNSILQMLVFCIPFYEFLDRVAKRAAHIFKSETPLIDAMILLMREYSSIDSTTSVEQLRLRLHPEDYEKYGDPFIPEYVYNVIKELPRFRDMRRGHQQDAQEFLGFLLEELHEECAHVMNAEGSVSSGRSTPVGSISNGPDATDNDGGWMEVGAKQKSAITRSSGANATESPVTNIFGGKLRSELKVAGNKLSVTLEPYQPLQLDIGSPQVNNIVDALKGLTRPESMQGDFQSARGTKTSATKQVLIETLPPVLILHLKRFHYDSTTKRVEKIWKKVGYPLELELPKEIFPTIVRNKYSAAGAFPKYRLIGAIYHHGRYASGGHYTVDIRRQDGREWIRLDDTLIRRVRSGDVAEGGSEEDPKVLAAALEKHNQGKATNNRFDQIEDEDEDEKPEKGWNQVNGHVRSKSSVAGLLNGASTPVKDSSGPQTPRERLSVKDNKVAYLLFYQRITA